MANNIKICFICVVIMVRGVVSISCQDGHFLSENGVCKKCPPDCVVCVSEKYCMHCEDGYAGDICEVYCSNCLPGTSCEKKTAFCSDSCLDGNTGLFCNLTCHANCMSCKRSDSAICLKCAHGRYGKNCIQKCFSSCKENTCNDDGMCKYGCSVGYWGNKCQYRCSEYCKDLSCSRENGTCISGCKTSDRQDTCLCPRYCDCVSEGNCTDCTFISADICNSTCSKGCAEIVCSVNSGECFEDCREVVDGFLCNIGQRKEHFWYGLIGGLILAGTIAIIIVCKRYKKCTSCRQKDRSGEAIENGQDRGLIDGTLPNAGKKHSNIFWRLIVAATRNTVSLLADVINYGRHTG